MRRRTFLTTTGGLIATATIQSLLPQPRARAAPLTRVQAWAPNPNVSLDWRYIAGRITAIADDYGFIVSISDQRGPLPAKQELLVQRQNFNGDPPSSESYGGNFTYASSTGTYTFQAASSPVSAIFQLDPNTQLYHLTLSSPGLSFTDIVLRPQGNLIPESGDGAISVGTVLGFQVASDYYADWTEVEIGGQVQGVARVDMQGLRPTFQAASAPAATSVDYDHHWFALAGTLDSEPVWISAWRIETTSGPLWDVTIAKGTLTNAPWVTAFKTEADTMAEPLTVHPLAWQPIPGFASSDGPSYTGTSWHLSAGVTQPGDLLDLTLTVPPGQFAKSARVGGNGTTGFLEEAVGVSATGTVQKQQLSGARLVVAETTAEFAITQLPLVQR
jgi:hypothetical protein